MTIPTIIYGILVAMLGLVVGVMWGLSRHVELLDWLQARTIRRWMAAMQSLGYKQEDIDFVLERMGDRIMPPYVPCPPSPERKSLGKQLAELNISTACHCTVYDEEWEPILQLCLDYADEIHAAADEDSGDNFCLDNMASKLLEEWKRRSVCDYSGRVQRVRIRTNKENGFIEVLFDAAEKIGPDIEDWEQIINNKFL